MTCEQAVAAVLRRAGARDPDTLAAEIFAVLRGHGWRPPRPRTVFDPLTRRRPDPPSDEYRRQRAALSPTRTVKKKGTE